MHKIVNIIGIKSKCKRVKIFSNSKCINQKLLNQKC